MANLYILPDSWRVWECLLDQCEEVAQLADKLCLIRIHAAACYKYCVSTHNKNAGV